MRGLARSHQQYYDALHNADLLRMGDYDGRGSLSQSGLVAWVRYFLGICIDQVDFMDKMLVSDSPRGSVYMGIPLDSLQFLFPKLWPEAEVSVANR